MFNVGEIIILPGGIVKSKEGMRKAAEIKEQRDKEEVQRKAIEKRYKDAETAVKLEAEEAQRAIDQGNTAPIEFPAKEALKRMKKPKKISKKQLKLQEQLEPQPIPPKPVIPNGTSLPEGGEDLLALWDITDEEIGKRLGEKKKEKTKSRKQLIKIQQENKKLNRALKVRKREADNAGVVFDKEKARKEILAENAESAHVKSESDSGLESDSDSASGLDSDLEADEENESKAAPVLKLNLELIEQAAEIKRAHKEKKQAAREKRKQERKQDAAEEEAKAAEEAARLEVERLAEAKALEEAQAGDEAKAAKKAKKAAKEAKKLAKVSSEESSSKKRKRTEDVEVVAEEEPKKDKSHKKKKSKSEVTEVEPPQDTRPAKKEKKMKESSDERLDKVTAEREVKMKAEFDGDNKPSHGAEQWNPHALTGDAARKDKFLRLLGAGKGASKGGEKDKKKNKDGGVDINKIQEELERQFQAGVKMKHDGGSKKRGLGA